MATNFNDTPTMGDAYSGDNSIGALALAYKRANPTPQVAPQASADISSQVDPRKVYLAREAGITDGLNAYERDFATKSVEENALKYGDQAYGIDSSIMETAAGDFHKSQVDRSPIRAVADTAIGIANGAAQGVIGFAEMANNLNPISYGVDKLLGTDTRGAVSSALGAISKGLNDFAEMGYSDEVTQDNMIRAYKNQMEVAQHQREYDEAIANGESVFGATMAQFGKDFASGFTNAFKGSTAWTQAPADLLGSILAMGGVNKAASLGMRAVSATGTALTRALGGGAERALAGTAERAATAGAERAGLGATEATAGTAERAVMGVTPEAETAVAGAERTAATVGTEGTEALAGNTATTAARAVAGETAEDTAKKGILERLMDNEMFQVGMQEGGGAAIDAYNEVMDMSDEDLTKSSEMYRKLKEEYLAKGLSDKEAITKAKEELAQSASTRAGLYNGVIAAPMGKLMPKGLIKNPIKTLADPVSYLSNTARETAEEGLENLGGIGANLAAQQTYDNDKGLLDDVALGMGESAGSAGLGTAEMGLPKFAKKALKATVGKGIDKVFGDADERSVSQRFRINTKTLKKESATLKEALNSAKNKVNAGDAEIDSDADTNAVTGSIGSTQRAADTLDKMSNLTSATFDSEEDVKEFNDHFDSEKAHIKVGDNKFKAMEDYAREMNTGLKDLEKVGINGDPEAAAEIFSKVRYFNKLKDSLFGDGDLDTVLKNVSEDQKDSVTKAYNAFDAMRNDTVYSHVLEQANQFADNIISNQEKIANNKNLTEEQKKASIKTILNAYTHKLDNTLMTADQLKQAEAFAEQAKQNGLIDESTSTSFLKEVNKAKDFNKKLDQAEQNRVTTAKILAHEMGENLTDEQIKQYMSGKDMNSVQYQKLNGIFGNGSARKSLASVKAEVARLMKEGKGDKAKQEMLDYMHFVQSQINKLNAYKKSHADWVKQHAQDGKGTKTHANAVQFQSYNPSEHVTYTNNKGIYAGKPILGYALVKETEALTDEFNILKDRYFANNSDLKLENADPNFGAVTNQELVNHYTGWKGYQAQKQFAQQNKKAKSSDNTTTNTDTNDTTENQKTSAKTENKSEAKTEQKAKAKENTKAKSNEKTEEKSKEKEEAKAVFDPFGDDSEYLNVMASIRRATGSAAYNEDTHTSSVKEWQLPQHKDLDKKKGTLTDKGMEHLTPNTNAERDIPKSRTYAVSGSRNLPNAVKSKFKRIASFLERKGITVRTNSSEGVGGIVEDSLSDRENHSQWMRSGSVANNYWASTTERAKTIAKQLMPNLEGAELDKVAASVYQVLGTDLDTPVDFVIAYSPKDQPNRDAEVIQLAEKLNIPVFNLADGNADEVFNNYSKWFTEKYAKEKELQDKQTGIIQTAVNNVLKELHDSGFSSSKINKRALVDLFKNLDPKNNSYAENDILDAIQKLGSQIGDINDATKQHLAYVMKQEFDAIQDKALQDQIDAADREEAATIRPDRIKSEVSDSIHQVNQELGKRSITSGVYKAIQQRLNGLKFAEATVTNLKAKLADIKSLTNETVTRLSEILSEKLLARSPEALAKQAKEQAEAEAKAKIKQESDNKTARFNNAKTKLLGLNSKFESLESFRDKLKPIAESNENKVGEVPTQDARLLLKELNPENKNSFFNKLKQHFANLCSSDKQLKAKKLYKKGQTFSIFNDDPDFPVYFNPTKGSPFYKDNITVEEKVKQVKTDEYGNEIKDDDGNPVYEEVTKKVQTKKNFVTYEEVMDVLNDPEKSNQVSQEEFEKLCELYPTLFLMKVNEETGKLELDDDLIGNMAVNIIALFNNQKEGSGYEWDRIAQDMGLTLHQILNVRTNGVPTGLQFLEAASNGIIKGPLYEGLHNTLRKSLGIKFNPNMTEAGAQNTLNVFSELCLAGLTQSDFIDEHDFPIGNNISVFTIKGEESILNSISDPLALNTLLGNERAGEEGSIFAEGTEPTDSDSGRRNTYLHSSIPLTKEALEARSNYEKVNYRLDTGMCSIYHALANDKAGNGIITLYGEDVSDPDNMDPEDRISKESANRLLINAFNKLSRWEGLMNDVADSTGTAISKVYKRFKLGFTSVNRVQELESYGPIANKLTREGLLSTWNTVDITNNKSDVWKELSAAVIQNFGGKVNNNTLSNVTAAFTALTDEITAHEDKYEALMKLVRDPSNITAQDVINAQNSLKEFMGNSFEFKAIGLKGVDQNFMGLHAMQTLAQVINAKKNNESSIECSLYVECDGTTNGTIFGRFLLTHNIEDQTLVLGSEGKDLGEDFIETMDHGNTRIGDIHGAPAGEVKHDLVDANGKKIPKDIYEKSAKIAEAKIQAHIDEVTNPDNMVDNSKAYKEYFAKYPHSQENRVIISEKEATTNGRSNKQGKSKTKTVTQKVVSDFKNANEPVSPKDYCDAVDTLFRTAGLTSGLLHSLTEEISRSFMKSPDTKGGYSAGMASIINTFLYGDRNVPGILRVMHANRTKVMRAEAALGNQVISDTQIAKAIFGGMEGTEHWSDSRYLDMLYEYVDALNTVTQNKLISITDPKTGKTTYKCAPTYVHNKTANTVEIKNDEDEVVGVTHANFSTSSFCKDHNADVASISLSDDNVTRIFEAVKEVYGKSIVEAVNETLKNEGMTPANDAIIDYTDTVTTINNLLQDARIDKFDPNFDTVGDANDRLRVFNKVGTPTSNTIQYNGSVAPIGYTTSMSNGDRAGGSINNVQEFARYGRTIAKSRLNTHDKSTGVLKYDYIEEPGVRLVPSHTQNNGDAKMMQSDMRPGGATDAVDKKCTDIYDGKNIAVGYVSKGSNAINQTMFETGMENTLEPWAQDAFMRKEFIKQQTSGKDAETSDAYRAAEMMAEAVNYVVNPDGKTSQLPVDNLINAYVKLFNKASNNTKYTPDEIQSARIKAVAKFLKDKQEALTSKYTKGYVEPSYKMEDFLIHNFNNKTIRAAVKRQVFMEIMAKFEPLMIAKGKNKFVATEEHKNFSKFSVISSNDYSTYNLSTKFFELMKNVPDCPHNTEEWKALLQDEYVKCLSYFMGDMQVDTMGNATYKPAVMGYAPVTTEKALNLISNSADRAYETFVRQSQGVSQIHAAIYCMGATCDHMASGNNPYVLDPRKEGISGFIKMLRKNHLKPKAGLDENAIFQKYCNSEPRKKLDELQHNYANSRDFVNTPSVRKERANILRSFQQFIQENTEYVLPEDQARHNAALEDKRVKDLKSSRNVKSTTVQKYLTSNKETNSINHVLSEFSDIFEQDHQTKAGSINKNTKIITFTGYENKQQENTPLKARTEARELLLTQYKEDMKAVGKTPNPDVENYIIGTVALNDNVSNFTDPNDRNYVGVQFYEPATDTIYCLSANPSGTLNSAQSNMLHDVRLPHEIMHSMADKCLAYFETEFNNNYRQYKADKANKLNNAWWKKLSKKEKLAMQALDRMHQLKDLIDSTLASDPDLEELAKTNPAINFYLRNREADNTSGKAMQEFVAYFGSLSDDQVKALTDAIIARKGAGNLTQLAKDTRKDVNLLQQVLNTFKKLYQSFIGLIFNKKPEDDTVRDIVLNNLSILSAVRNENYLDKNGRWQAQLADPSQTVSFLNEITDNGLDPSVEVNGETATCTSNATPTSTLNSVEKLANSITKTLKERVRALKTAQINAVKTGTLHQIAERELAYMDRLEQVESIALQLGDDDNIVNNIIRPLENLGFHTGDPDAFAKVIGSLSLLQDIKSPVFTEVSLATKKILDTISPESFCTDSLDQAQLDRGLKITTFLQGMSENGLKANEIAPVFLVLSQTDPAFRKILSNIKFPQKNTEGYLALDKFFNNVTNKAVDAIDHIKHEKPTINFANAFDNFILKMIKDEGSVVRDSLADRLANKVDEAITNTFTALSDKVSNSLGKRFGLSDGLFSNTSATILENKLNQTNLPHAAKEVIHDLVGCTEQNQKFYTMNTIVKTATQQSRENAREQIPLATKKRFKTKVTDEQWSRFSRTIGKSGLASLFSNNTSDLANLLRSPGRVSSEIDQLAKSIGDKYQIAKCKQLANYMLTGKAGKMLLRNPVAIAMKLGSRAMQEATKENINACDKLTSLFALQQMSSKDCKELADLLETDSDAMKALLNTAKNQYQKGMDKANGTDRGKLNWYKGSLPSDFKNGAHFKIAPLSRRNEMERFGYKLERNYKGSNLDGIEMGVFYADFSQKNYLNPGAIQLTSNTGNGIDLTTGASLHPNGGMITNLKNVNAITARMNNYYAHEGEDLMPVFDGDGNIVAYERSIDPSLLNDNKYVSPTTDYAELLGIQEGRNTEEEMIQEFNNQIVNTIYDRYKKDKKLGNDKYYVNLYDVKDPVVKNIVKMIPSDLREYIAEVYGNDKFMVLPSEINDIIGYHSASITDSWTGESRLPPAVQNAFVAVCEKMMGKNAFKYLKKSEDFIHDVTVSAKNMIIIRSAVVPAMNMMANMIQLYIEGVPVSTIVKGSLKVAKELNQYTKLTTQLVQIEQELKGETIGYRQKQLEAQKNVTKAAIEHLSISKLLELKEFSSIANVGDIGRSINFSDGTLGDKILELVDQHTKGDLARSAIHYGFVAPDTSLYKFLEKTNQYGDFIGKAVLYQDLVQRRGWTHEQAHLKVKDEFVDYVRLPGRGRDYMERMGLLWFYNFKLRMQKVAFANMKEHPLRCLALSAMGLPTPLTDSLLGKLPVLSYTMGPIGMLGSAFTSNPWVALLGLLF